MTEEQKRYIDSLSQEDLCRKWRFAKVGDPLFLDECGEYFKRRLQEKGGMTAEISKRIGFVE